MGRVSIVFIFLLIFSFTCRKGSSQEREKKIRNVLYINSYAIAYPWSDSLVSGIQQVFSKRADIQLYIEFLDANRFGKSEFEELYELYKEKYKNIRFDAAISSDNDALDFLMLYGDSLIPDIPIAFCGINNPEDYNFENTGFYGILDAVDLKAEIDLIERIMPDVKKLYFITDSSTTSLLNYRYIRELEPEYANRLQFVYIHNVALDSLMTVVSNFEKGNAIALINYSRDEKGNRLNIDAINTEIVQRSPVPIFLDSQTMLGKGIAGGIINNGSIHGRETAQLALKFIDQPNYRPSSRVIPSRGIVYFDDKVLRHYGISNKLLPEGAVIINQPKTILRYLEFIVFQLVVIGFLLFIAIVLYINFKRRKRAEELVYQKLGEIHDKNENLKYAHQQVNEMNAELEEINEHLNETNEELKKAMQKSEESDRLKSVFLANMSHEIRTPLNAIIGFSSLLSDSSITPEDREEYFRIINSNSDLLLHIIDDILDLSKIEAGQLKIFVETFSVQHMLTELVNSFSQSNSNNQVNIRLLADDINNELKLKSDPIRFKQILGNLLSNALKFTKRGVIEIGYHFANAGEITFFVKDTGIGIEPENLENVFDRFWKAKDQGKKYYSGTGLGLSISKKLCEALGAKIWVESAQGTGSTFFVAFKDSWLKKGDAKPHKTRKVDPNHPNWEGFTIAIAEDESNNLYLLTRILKGLHADIIGFSNGIEIVTFFSNSPHKKVDLILMDIKLPGMDGITATRLIREIHPDIPIIAQTAYAMIEDVNKIQSHGFDDYIAKPILPSLLIEKMNRFLYPETG